MKILIKLPNWIGDAVMASSLIENIKENMENPEITLVGRPHILELYDIDKFIIRKEVDNTKSSKKRVQDTKILASKVGKHDIAFILTNNFLSAMFAFYTKTKIRVGYKKELRGVLLTHSIKENKGIHFVKQYDNLLNSYLETELPDRKLRLNKKIEASNKNYIVIAPGAAFGDAKQWDVNGYIYLINNLQDEYNIKIVGSTMEKELVESIMDSLSSKKNVDNLVEKTSISELVEVIANSELIVTNDSGPMHIAAAFSKKTVAIYGPTNEKYSHPWMNDNAIVMTHDIECRPCNRKKCPIHNNNCMILINKTEVLIEVEKLLNRKMS